MARIKRGLLISAVLVLGVVQAVQILTPSVDAAVFTPPWQPGTVTDIQSGYDFSCAIASSDVYCWGDNAAGQLGDGTTTNRLNPVKVSGLPAGKQVTALTLGLATACALVDDGSAYCWGANQGGVLGNGNTVNSSAPVKIAGLLNGKNVTQISMGRQGAHYICAVADGSAYCWGEDSNGRLGNAESSSTVPTQVIGALAGNTNVTQIVAGSLHTCAIANGQVYCWGRNISGEVGNATNSSGVTSSVAVSTSGVLAGKQMVNVVSGASHTCALSSDGAAYCWGADNFGQLGNGDTTNSNVPVKVVGLLADKNVTQLSASGEFTCAIANGAGYCWGPDQHDGLGNGNVSGGNLPVAVSTSGVLAGKTLTSIAAPYGSAYAIAAGHLYSWGSNEMGRLGNGSNDTSVSTPVAVDTSGALAGKTVSKIARGELFTCALASGDVYCWGYNFGRLGNGSNSPSSVPVTVGRKLVVTDVSSNQMDYAPGATMDSYVLGEGFTADTIVKYGDQVVPVKAVTSTMLTVTVTAPVGLVQTISVDVSVTNPGTATDTLSQAFTYNVPPPKVISGVEFVQDQGKSVLNVNGSSYYTNGGSDVNDALFGLFIVTLNGESILPCAGGDLLSALETIDGAVFTAGQPCFFTYSFDIGQQLMSPSQIKIWLPDNFDSTLPGTVSINGSNVYSFNSSVVPDPNDGAGEGTVPPVVAGGAASPSASSVIGQLPLLVAALIAQSQPSTDETPTAPSLSVDKKEIEGEPTISSLPIFRGKTIPYSTVVVTVHSNPVTCTTKADEEGNWACQLTDKLPAGNHTVNVAMTSPDNQTTYMGPYPVKVAAVASAEDDTAPVLISQSEQKSGLPLWAIITGAAVLVVVLAMVVVGMSRRHRA